MWSFTCFRRPRKKDQLSSGKSAVLSSCVPYLSFFTVLYQFPTVLNILYSLLTKVFSLIYDSTSRFPSWSRQSSFQIHSYIWALKLVFLKKREAVPKCNIFYILSLKTALWNSISYTFWNVNPNKTSWKKCFLRSYVCRSVNAEKERRLCRTSR